jgi:hypothetical protein
VVDFELNESSLRGTYTWLLIPQEKGSLGLKDKASRSCGISGTMKLLSMRC